jgi:adenylosuccinate synthase
MSGLIRIVVGGAYGSEAKGQAIETFAKEGKMDVCVRTGALNAGHTVYYKNKPYAMQTVPAGWCGGEEIALVIGRGAFIEEATLKREIAMVKEALGVSALSLFIDPMAGTHGDSHKEAESTLHGRMGSTGKGCMAASIDKMKREFGYKNFGDTAYAKENNGREFVLCDTVKLLNDLYDDGQQIVLEGTQGTLLDLFHGDYPYVTARSTIAANWLMEAGLAPTLNIKTTMVVRTFPIRVAGNSGPLPDEVGWAELARELGLENVGLQESDVSAFEDAEGKLAQDWGFSCLPHKMVGEERVNRSIELSHFHSEVLKMLPEDVVTRLKSFFEITTVTKKLRRISRLSLPELQRAALLNRPTGIFLTFLNYYVPATKGMTDWDDMRRSLSMTEYNQVISLIKAIEDETKAPVNYIGTDRQAIIKVPQGIQRKFA